MVGDELRITPGLLGGVSQGKSSIISMCLTHRQMLVHLKSSGETKKVGQECGGKVLHTLLVGRHPPGGVKNKQIDKCKNKLDKLNKKQVRSVVVKNCIHFGLVGIPRWGNQVCTNGNYTLPASYKKEEMLQEKFRDFDFSHRQFSNTFYLM